MLRVAWNAWLEKHTIYGGSTCGDGGKWRSPLFMPEWAARYFIKILDIQAGRLQEITENDAIKEGVILKAAIVTGTLVGEPTYRDSYALLWDSINPKQKWNTDPFVFRYEFKKEV